MSSTNLIDEGASRLRRPGFNWKRAAWLAALAGLVSLASSCSKSGDLPPVYPVRGTLAYNGEAVPGAFVVLHPLSAPGIKNARPSARVAPDGTFRVGTFSAADGAPAGEYIVTVEWHKLVISGRDAVAGPNVLPARYSSPKTSDLRIKVVDGTNELPPLQLSDASANDDAATQ
jgi:hypothetical protein